ncbi:MAG: hypothetical protein ACE5EM_13095 [Sphingomonadales bacterium]
MIFKVPELPCQFGFMWADIPFSAHLSQLPDADMVTLDLTGDLGELPFTAEAETARADLRASLLSDSETFPGSFDVSPDNRVSFSNRTLVPAPTTSDKVMTALVISLLQVGPFVRTVKGLTASISERRDPGQEDDAQN